MTTLTLPRSAERAGRLVLIEQNALLCRSLERFFGLYFDEVRAVHDTAAAMPTFRSSSVTTDVICGLWETGASTISELVTQWRRKVPAMRRVLVVTGDEKTPAHIDGVDAVIRKPFAPEALIHYFVEGWHRRNSDCA